MPAIPGEQGRDAAGERTWAVGMLTAVCVLQSGRLIYCSVSAVVGDTVQLPSLHGPEAFLPSAN